MLSQWFSRFTPSRILASSYGPGIPMSPLERLVQSAIHDGKRLRFSYDTLISSRVRTIHPTGLLYPRSHNQDSDPYVVGHYESGFIEHRFLLSHMSELTPLD
ncbi:WYL domain-containing protein [Pseudomonas sp. CGJS7]|uniref:WYL domain-containing protein n=1 Tax=Pseudomonas sp. CGJS7 TaxID=3109348 RepID=UPI003009B2B5